MKSWLGNRKVNPDDHPLRMCRKARAKVALNALRVSLDINLRVLRLLALVIRDGAPSPNRPERSRSRIACLSHSLPTLEVAIVPNQ